MKADARRILEAIRDYTELERKFLDRFLDDGRYEPDLLFENANAHRLEEHPAVLWKLQNVRKYKGLQEKSS